MNHYAVIFTFGTQKWANIIPAESQQQAITIALEKLAKKKIIFDSITAIPIY